MILTVTVPNIETFEAYDYGYGTVLNATPCEDRPGWLTITVEYHSGDTYHAEVQQARFASGLYFASLERN